MERNEFTQQAMQVKSADWWQWVRAGLCKVTMNALAAHQEMHYGGLDTKPRVFATTKLIRWLPDMLPVVETVARWGWFLADEVVITNSRSAKWVYPEQRVFVEEKDRLPHFTTLPCMNPEGGGPAPMLVVLSLACAKEVSRAWRA
jgi:hypothetical protein